MNERFPNSPETSEMIKAESGKAFREQLREKVLNALDQILRKLFDTKEIQKDFERLADAQQDAKQLSTEAGEFFRGLIPDGLRKPEIDGVPNVGSANWIMASESTERHKLFTDEVEELSLKEYKNQRNEILKDSLHGRERLTFEGGVEENERLNGVVEQTTTNASKQDGNQNLIYERVSNTIDRPGNTNYAESSLVIQDIKNGITLDLNALLPSNCKFVPRAMDKELFFQPDAESITGKSYKQKEVADLKNYKMGESDPEGFAMRPSHKIVNYGDLKKTGGILSLLHEVAHAWQNKYYHTSDQGRAGFEGIYETVTTLISKLELPKDSEDYEEPDKIWEQLEKSGIECLDKNGTEIPTNQEGVINIPNAYFELAKYVETLGLPDTKISQSGRDELPSMLAKTKSQIRFYPIKSAAFQKTMDTYVSEERDAWAHAIMIVRFLKGKGIDVEPELKKLEDIKKVIDPCLASYQNSLEKTIFNKQTGYRFSKIPK